MSTSPIDSVTLRRAADAAVEAALLVAVVSLPLYFTALTETGYEPDKAVLLRSIAVVALAGMVLGWRSKAVAGFPLPRLIPILGIALFSMYAVATAMSIDSRLSLFGSVTRQQGLGTWAAYLIIFLAAATRLRDGVRIRRLVDLILLGSLPVVVYAYMQQLGFDPVPSSGDPTTLFWPVRSSLGQHVFFGSYMVMIIPLTAVRLLENWSFRRESVPDPREAAPTIALLVGIPTMYVVFIAVAMQRTTLFAVMPAVLAVITGAGLLANKALVGPRMGRLRFGWYALLLSTQVVSLAFSSARGSWLAALAGVPVLGLCMAYRARKRALAFRITAVAFAAGLLLLLLNIPGGPLQPVRSIPALNRVANITESGGAGGSAQGRLFIWQGVLRLVRETPAIGSTWSGPGRDVVGYGPESMHWAFQAVFPLRLRQVTSEIWNWDRAHDIYLDRLVDAGVPGLLLFLALACAVLVRSFFFIAKVPPNLAWILAGLVVAEVSHLVDGIFSLETAVTLGLFWLLAGLSAGLPWMEDSLEDDVAPPGTWRIVAGGAAITVLLCAFVLLPGVGNSAPFLAILWTVSIVGGISLVTALGAAGTFAIPSLPVLRITLAGAILVAGLAVQTSYQGAAIAERLGLDSLSAGRTTDAFDQIQAAARLQPQEPQYVTDLAGAILTLSSGHTDSADPSLVATQSDIYSVSGAKASTLGRDQLLALSTFSLQKARILAPLDPDAYYNLGNLALQRGEPSVAVTDYAAALVLSPDNPRYMAGEALALAQQNKIEQALRTAQAAVRLDTGFWYSHYALAQIAQRLHDSTLARQEATQALYWQKNFWPHPPESRLAEMRAIVNGPQ